MLCPREDSNFQSSGPQPDVLSVKLRGLFCAPIVIRASEVRAVMILALPKPECDEDEGGNYRVDYIDYAIKITENQIYLID